MHEVDADELLLQGAINYVEVLSSIPDSSQKVSKHVHQIFVLNVAKVEK